METQKCKLSEFIDVEKLNQRLIEGLKAEFSKHEMLGMAVMDLEKNHAVLCDYPVDIMRDDISETTGTLMTLGQLIEQVSAKIKNGYDRDRFIRSVSKSTLQRKLQMHSIYSFIVCTENEHDRMKVEKYTFAAVDPDNNMIIWNSAEITQTLEYDVLTGGRNRVGFLHLLQDQLETGAQPNEYTLLYFNLQSFHHINELYGQAAGDAALRHFYTNLGYSALTPVCYARTESDHFYCLIRSANFNSEVITSLCRQSFEYNGKVVPFHCLCGVYHIIDLNESPASLCGRAKIAANYISDAFNQPWKEFDDKMRMRYISDGDIVDRLDYALKNSEIQPYFQPIVNARTERIEMAEALVRWNSPKYGFVSPADFIPSLEKHGSISRVDMYMADKIFELIRTRLRNNQPIVPIDVNVSWIDFGDNEFIEQLVSHLKDPEVPNDMCRYEITESTIAEMTESRHQILDVFKKENANLLIDDFGKGYSFTTMRNIDFCIVKLDKSLIDEIGVNNKADLLIETLIGMFHKMGAKVVAEGVEKLQQVEYLRRVGCDYIQGFYYYRPMPEAQFIELLEQQNETEDQICADEESEQVWIERDVLEAQYANLKLRADEAECLRMHLDNEKIYVFEWDVKTHIDVCSNSFKELYNLPSNEIPNMPEVAPLCHPDDMERFQEIYRRAARGERYGEDYFRILAPDGKSYSWFRKTFYTLFDRNNKAYKVILTMQDCTDKYKYIAEQKRNDLLVRQQEVITFSYTLADDTLSFTFLLPNGNVHTMSIPHYLATPTTGQTNDQKLLSTQLREKLAMDDNKYGYIDFWDERFNQELRAHYYKVESAYGNLYAFVGQAENINRTRERLVKTIADQQQYISVTEGLRKIYNIAVSISIGDRKMNIVLVDPQYKGVIPENMTFDDIIPCYVNKALKPKDRAAFIEFIDPETSLSRLEGNRYISLEYEDEIFGWIRAYILPSGYDKDGNVTNVVFAAQPISSEKNNIDRLVKLSETDSLTGIRNRYSGEISVERALEEKRPGVFAILDCDKFKYVNDNFGHVVGDNLLVKLAACISEANADGITMRLGGDEFALYLYGNRTDEEINTFFSNLFRQIESLEVEGLHDFPIAMSAGVTRNDGVAETNFDTIYRKADALLYESKKTAGCKLTL